MKPGAAAHRAALACEPGAERVFRRQVAVPAPVECVLDPFRCVARHIVDTVRTPAPAQDADRGGEYRGYKRDAMDFLAKGKHRYDRIVLDPQKRISEAWRISSYPTTVLLDRRGRQVWRRRGEIRPEDAEVVSAIEDALKTAEPAG